VNFTKLYKYQPRLAFFVEKLVCVAIDVGSVVQVVEKSFLVKTACVFAGIPFISLGFFICSDLKIALLVFPFK